MTIDVDLVCTEQDLVNELMSREQLYNILPKEYATDGARMVRQQVLDDVLISLSRRVPPIYEEHIADPAALRRAVSAGTIYRLYLGAMTGQGDVFAEQMRFWRTRYNEEILGVRPVLADRSIANTFSIRIERR